VRPVSCNVQVTIGYIGDCETGAGIDSFEVMEQEII
jgi:hypothetical protein